MRRWICSLAHRSDSSTSSRQQGLMYGPGSPPAYRGWQTSWCMVSGAWSSPRPQARRNKWSGGRLAATLRQCFRPRPVVNDRRMRNQSRQELQESPSVVRHLEAACGISNDTPRAGFANGRSPTLVTRHPYRQSNAHETSVPCARGKESARTQSGPAAPHQHRNRGVDIVRNIAYQALSGQTTCSGQRITIEPHTLRALGSQY